MELNLWALIILGGAFVLGGWRIVLLFVAASWAIFRLLLDATDGP